MKLFIFFWIISILANLYFLRSIKEVVFQSLKNDEDIRKLKPSLVENDEKLNNFIDRIFLVLSLLGPILLIFLIVPPYDE